MSKSGDDRSSDPPGLSEHDLELWTHAMREVRPKAGKRREIESAALPRPTEARGSRRSTPVVPRPASHPAPAAGFDRRKLRKIVSGRVEIEARLDLHGLYQEEAHAALRRFLLSSSAAGLRHVIVITGRGTRRAGTGDEVGVLRRNVPRWLSGPELRAVVVGYSTAHVRHGGAGALYITLRTSKMHEPPS